MYSSDASPSMSVEDQGYSSNTEAHPSSFFNQMSVGPAPPAGPDVTRSSYFGGAEEKSRSSLHHVLIMNFVAVSIALL